MDPWAGNATVTTSPLEQFFRDYVEAIDGACDEVEPQVYDVLLPPVETDAPWGLSGEDVLRVAFDPEAIAEHPGAQLASLGTPLVDRLLGSAISRGRGAQAYVNGLNLAPHDLRGRVRRTLDLAEGLELRIERVRPLHFTQAVFWFQATFLSDQKEQEILPMAVDLHSGRQVRHLEALLDDARLAERPAVYLPEARRPSLPAVYPTVHQEIRRTVASLANARRRELDQQVESQTARTVRYYADLRSELDTQIRRARDRGDDLSKYAVRREAIDREQRLRVADLRQKSTLRVQLRLGNLLLIGQPKLLLPSTVTPLRRPAVAAQLDLVWDPLIESLEAASCPQCQSPTFILRLDQRCCPSCPACGRKGRAPK